MKRALAVVLSVGIAVPPQAWAGPNAQGSRGFSRPGGPYMAEPGALQQTPLFSIGSPLELGAQPLLEGSALQPAPIAQSLAPIAAAASGARAEERQEAPAPDDPQEKPALAAVERFAETAATNADESAETQGGAMSADWDVSAVRAGDGGAVRLGGSGISMRSGLAASVGRTTPAAERAGTPLTGTAKEPSRADLAAWAGTFSIALVAGGLVFFGGVLALAVPLFPARYAWEDIPLWSGPAMVMTGTAVAGALVGGVRMLSQRRVGLKGLFGAILLSAVLIQGGRQTWEVVSRFDNPRNEAIWHVNSSLRELREAPRQGMGFPEFMSMMENARQIGGRALGTIPAPVGVDAMTSEVLARLAEPSAEDEFPEAFAQYAASGGHLNEATLGRARAYFKLYRRWRAGEDVEVLLPAFAALSAATPAEGKSVTDEARALIGSAKARYQGRQGWDFLGTVAAFAAWLYFFAGAGRRKAKNNNIGPKAYI